MRPRVSSGWDNFWPNSSPLLTTRVRHQPSAGDQLRSPAFCCVWRRLYNTLDAKSMDRLTFDLSTIAWVVGVAVVAVVAGRVTGRTLLRYGKVLAARTEDTTDDFLVVLFARVIEFGIYTIGLLMILSLLDQPIGPLLTGAGVAGLLIGLAGREVLSNTLAGLFIIADRPFEVGERVLLPAELGGTYGRWGDVVQIGLRSTRVRSTDGVFLTIPNANLVNEVVVNFSHDESPHLRVRIRIGLEPDWDNVRRAMETVEDVVVAHPGVIDDPSPPEVVLRDIREYDVILEVRFYVRTARLMRRTKSAIIQEILKAFEANRIRIATPVARVQLADPAGGVTAAILDTGLLDPGEK
jgi:small-conductance mechanosensitive channel